MRLKVKRIAIVLFLMLLLLSVWHFSVEEQAFYMVSYSREDISGLIRKKNLSEKDFMTVYAQTGVSPYAARELIQNNDYEVLENLNDLYFEAPEIEKDFIAYPVTLEERNTKQKTPFANLKKGDILVTFNTRTLDWRHGHCGLVLDEESGILLEHMSVGNVSCKTNINDWGTYPGFVVLRYKDEEAAHKTAEYAKNHLLGVPYSIFAGIIDKDSSVNSHCSHIVWKAYKSIGIDIDGDGGLIVTPKDISMSENLEVVQIYGINPEKYKDRIKK